VARRPRDIGGQIDRYGSHPTDLDILGFTSTNAPINTFPTRGEPKTYRIAAAQHGRLHPDDGSTPVER